MQLMKQLWRLPFFIVAWILFVAIKLPTMVAGWFVVPFMYAYNDVLYDRLPWWQRPWANPEDWLGGHKSYEGSLPKWWVSEKGIGFWSFYKYHAWRNPANGLRSFEWIDLDIDPGRVKYISNGYLQFYEPWYVRQNSSSLNTYWYLCWQGFQAGLKFVHHWPDLKRDIMLGPFELLKAGPHHLVIKFGWRVEPRDATVPIDPDGLRVTDSGFASKLLVYREG